MIRFYLMATTHKISAELGLDDFGLIAVHSDVEDFTLAYHLNRMVKLQLRRSKKDLILNEKTQFPIFEWMDDVSDNYWTLIANSCKVQQETLPIGFFETETSVANHYVIEERKEVDYFLKVETENLNMVHTAVRRIKEIPQIMTAYSIDPGDLRSRKNLIF